MKTLLYAVSFLFWLPVAYYFVYGMYLPTLMVINTEQGSSAVEMWNMLSQAAILLAILLFPVAVVWCALLMQKRRNDKIHSLINSRVEDHR